VKKTEGTVVSLADGGDVVNNSGGTGISRSSGSPVPDVPGRALDQFADKDDQQ
jgi:hypothetical protein